MGAGAARRMGRRVHLLSDQRLLHLRRRVAAGEREGRRVSAAPMVPHRAAVLESMALAVGLAVAALPFTITWWSPSGGDLVVSLDARIHDARKRREPGLLVAVLRGAVLSGDGVDARRLGSPPSRFAARRDRGRGPLRHRRVAGVLDRHRSLSQVLDRVCQRARGLRVAESAGHPALGRRHARPHGHRGGGSARPGALD